MLKHCYGSQIIRTLFPQISLISEVTGRSSVGISIRGEVNPVMDRAILKNICLKQDDGIYIGLGTGTVININLYYDVITRVYQQQYLL